MNDAYFMKMALAEAEKALAAGEFPVGCVLVAGNQVVAAGSRTGTAGGGRKEIDHAEIVALRRMLAHSREPPPSPLAVFSTMEPCLMCMGALLINHVTEIVYAYEDVMGGATNCRLSDLGPLYRDIKLDVRAHVMRPESLALFKAFFGKPENAYWRDSLLARYTLAQ
jgi:tRNA(adenine34) deaminase